MNPQLSKDVKGKKINIFRIRVSVHSEALPIRRRSAIIPKAIILGEPL